MQGLVPALLRSARAAAAAAPLLAARGGARRAASLSAAPLAPGAAFSPAFAALGAAAARAAPRPALAGAGAGAGAGVDAGAGASAAAAASSSAAAAPVQLRGPNTREPRKSNHGARPCSSIRRRRKYKTRVNPHPFIPLSKQKEKKGVDYVAP